MLLVETAPFARAPNRATPANTSRVANHGMRLAHLPRRAQEQAPTATLGAVRVLAFVAVGMTVWLTVSDTLALAVEQASPGSGLHAGALAAAVVLPLPLRHLHYGLRGERPPRGPWTLALLALTMVAGASLAGAVWMRQLAAFAVSALIVLPDRRGVTLAVLTALTPLIAVNAEWHAAADQVAGAYLTVLIVWRTVTQIVPLRLLAVVRALDAANEALASHATMRTRLGVEEELRVAVVPALARIVTTGVCVRAAAATNPADAAAALRALVAESRTTMRAVRRVVSRANESTVRAELLVAVALLEADGAHVLVEVADDVALDATDPSAREVIRAAIARVLGGPTGREYRLRLARGDERRGEPTLRATVLSCDAGIPASESRDRTRGTQ